MRHLDQLEVRRLLASFTASSAAELIADISAAKQTAEADTITLATGSTFTLTAVDHRDVYGSGTGLPAIAAGDDLTIVGNGNSIQRSTAPGTPAFRLFDVEAGGSLALRNLTLSNGLVDTAGGATGGGIVNLGTLSLDGSTIQSCIAQPSYPALAFGGGIFSRGTLSIANSTIRNNQALGGAGTLNAFGSGVADPGGHASGGGIDVRAGSATVTNSAIYSNVARGGDGADAGFVMVFDAPEFFEGSGGGPAWGGGISVWNATLQLRATTITDNTARGGAAGKGFRGTKLATGGGFGGGLSIASTASVGLDTFTQSSFRRNTASTSGKDIFGSFTIL
jgi:hypothetical protein